MNEFLARRALKIAIFLSCLVPLGRLAIGSYSSDLGANPVEFIEHATGDWAIRLLLVTLAITPLRRLTGWSRLAGLRRMLGLFAFFYAVLHFSAYLWFDQQFDLKAILEDIGKRRYITVGFLSWVSMAALAVTSTAGWVRRMGLSRWQRLHKLVYLAGLASVIHYYWLVKSDIRLPALYGAILCVLMLARLPWLWARGMASSSFRARLREIRRETEDTVTLAFDLPPGKVLNPKPGQFLTFDWIVNGEKLPRSYSISSAPRLKGAVEITVKKQGVVSTFLNETASVGLEVVATGPYGRFALDPGQHSVPVFIAGGSGITPIVAMLRHLEEVAPYTKALLFYASRSDSNVIFKSELQRLHDKLPNLGVIMVITEPSEGWTGERGRVSKEILQRGLGEMPRQASLSFFLCGPGGFMMAVKEILAELGARPDQILQERFSASATAKSNAAPVATTIEFARSGKRLQCTSADTILSVADKYGIAIPASCRIGQCGTCATRILSGDVEMDSDEGLTPEMRSEGFSLVCVGRARGVISVDA